MYFLAALLALAAVPQTPPCLAPFQGVTPLSAGVPGYSISTVEVDGDVALAIGAVNKWSGNAEVHVDAFERDPVTGIWRAVQSLMFMGRVVVSAQESFELDGERAILPLVLGSQVDPLVLERDPSTGIWLVADIIPVTSNRLIRTRLNGGRVAMSFEMPERIEIWAQSTGGWILEDTVLDVNPWGLNFTVEFELEDDRLVSNSQSHFVVYRRTSAGLWASEFAARPPEGFQFNQWFEPPFFADGRWVQMLQVPGSAGAVSALGYWRISEDSLPTRAIADRVLESAALPFALESTMDAVLAGGTMVTTLASGSCPGTSVDNRALAVISTGRSDAPAVRGRICTLEGGTQVRRARDIDYDGFTFAAAVQEYVGGVGVPSVQFAVLLGSDHDRDGDCVRDTEQIALQPDLDLNANGRLDQSEVRGSTNCAPTSPNSSGAFASLRIIGTEFVPITDLTAVLGGLPASTVGVLVVARAALPGAPSGPFALCIGAGTGSPLTRYPVFQANAQGGAAVSLAATSLPGAAHVPGDTWGWQFVYRDGASVATSAAVRVALH